MAGYEESVLRDSRCMQPAWMGSGGRDGHEQCAGGLADEAVRLGIRIENG